MSDTDLELRNESAQTCWSLCTNLIKISISFVSSTVSHLIQLCFVLALGIWAMVASYGMKSVPNNAEHCQVNSVKGILFTHGMVCFVVAVLQCLHSVAVLLEHFALPRKDDGGQSSFISSCVLCFQGCAGITTTILLVVMSVKTFGHQYCKTEAPLLYAYAKPYLIGNFVLIGVTAALEICLLCCVCCGALSLVLFMLVANSDGIRDPSAYRLSREE